MEELIAMLKVQIVDSLGLEDVTPTEIGDNDPLFVEGLGLDSIDALELVVMVEKHHGIRLKDMETSKAAFESVRTLAEFISANRPAD